MKALIPALTLCLSAFSHGADDTNLSAGLGTDHAGVAGVKYALNHGKSKYYASVALLGYSSAVGGELGYGIGWERLIASDKHALGLFAGTVSMDENHDEAVIYHGLAGTYNFYFNGFTERSWVLGGSAYSGVTSDDNSYIDDNASGIFVKVAFQW